jgi:chaperonin GroEL
VVKEGIIPDGSVALPLAPLNLSKLKADDNNQRLRIEIVRKTIQPPLRQIAENGSPSLWPRIVALCPARA